MKFPRRSGILLHPTSLPGPHGIGDLGEQAYRFVDFLAAAGQTYWQVLPLGPTGWGDSPYASFSAFAGNTLLISPEKLIEDGLLPAAWGAAEVHSLDGVDYGAVYESKNAMLRAAFQELAGADDGMVRDFDGFAEENSAWLDDYALYRAVKASQGQKPWYEWSEALKTRDPAALGGVSATLRAEIRAEKFYQFAFFRQWSGLKAYANANGVKIAGDVPIFVALDSCDVWCNQDQFKLNADGSPKVVSGVPPDYFSKTGQLWGNPIYDWDAMRARGFSWWIERIRHTLTMVDVARIDHFRGFAAAWEVPGGDSTAENGEWVDAPGRELFEALRHRLGDLPVWIEDLGFMTPDADALRDDFEFPGMRILQFAFGGDAQDLALPHNYVPHSVAYTGTHDNDTVLGWWNSLDPESHARQYCLKYLDTDGDQIHWAMIRAAWASVADSAVVPLQDILGLAGEARMNLPATTSGNWQWRFREGDLNDAIADRLRDLTETYGRKAPGEGASAP
jgi:4-alpha-glucanotransferase